VGETVSRYLDTAEQMGGLTQALDLGAALMTGNVVGAAINVFGLFDGGGPLSDDSSSQIAALSAQIAELHRDMDARFDRIDASLNVIFNTLSTDFNNINYRLGVIAGGVQAVQAGLLNIETKLDELEQYLLDAERAQSKQSLIAMMN